MAIKTKLVADISGNHRGSAERARLLIMNAADAGCHMVKFQLYRPEDMPDAIVFDNFEMYSRLRVLPEWLPSMYRTAERCNISLFASVFAPWAIEELKQYDCAFIKFASPESTRLEDATYDEMRAAISPGITLITSGMWYPRAAYRLYCPSGHPHELTLQDFARYHDGEYNGFSDHSTGSKNAIAMIEQEAMMIEKHIKLDDDCIDAAFSGTPAIFQTIRRFIG